MPHLSERLADIACKASFSIKCIQVRSFICVSSQTIAWLRTGLGAAGQDIPKAHLLATCDRVLRTRTEVQDAVAAKLQEVTPENLEQFELLIQDHRSIQRLADETLNDEHVVTAENANQL